MFLKSPASSEGAGDGLGVGAGDVCARTATTLNRNTNGRPMPKRHCERLFLRMLCSPYFLKAYLLTTNTTNESGLTVRCGRPPGVAAGVSVTSAVLKKIFCVLASKAIGSAPVS